MTESAEPAIIVIDDFASGKPRTVTVDPAEPLPLGNSALVDAVMNRYDLVETSIDTEEKSD